MANSCLSLVTGQKNLFLGSILSNTGLKTYRIYNSNRHTLIKSLELYKNLYYNENNQELEVIWYTLLIAKTFSELYKLAKKVLDEKKLKKIKVLKINLY